MQTCFPSDFDHLMPGAVRPTMRGDHPTLIEAENAYRLHAEPRRKLSGKSPALAENRRLTGVRPVVAAAAGTTTGKTPSMGLASGCNASASSSSSLLPAT